MCFPSPVSPEILTICDMSHSTEFYGRACPSSTAHSDLELEHNICVDSGSRRVKGVSFLITDVRLPTATEWCIEVISNLTRQKSSWESLLGIGRFSPHHWFGPFMTQAEDITLPTYLHTSPCLSTSLDLFRYVCRVSLTTATQPHLKPNDQTTCTISLEPRLNNKDPHMPSKMPAANGHGLLLAASLILELTPYVCVSSTIPFFASLLSLNWSRRPRRSSSKPSC